MGVFTFPKANIVPNYELRISVHMPNDPPQNIVAWKVHQPYGMETSRLHHLEWEDGATFAQRVVAAVFNPLKLVLPTTVSATDLHGREEGLTWPVGVEELELQDPTVLDAIGTREQALAL
ncbi:hypothetical protein BC938DRAFT_479340 [Jimgerdemannia flammicorona]|uniref:Uncharacterized protein n=1 Tax=Jimgerdemannia flammicorona TaxID=994334 RepID=A0A433QXV6_9FUNG|nr:hypothetical protein BC938DRAFT_479340 [Jimgerdemannia flammicorona]